MILVDRGGSCSTPHRDVPPRARRTGTAGVTVQQLLSHTSGCAPTSRTPTQGAARQRGADAARVAKRPASHPARVIYSDPERDPAREAVRRAAGEPPTRSPLERLFTPLGLQQTMFAGVPAQGRIAPTGVWRGHAVAGLVDAAARSSWRACPGRRPLFTARDVARFAQFMLGAARVRTAGRWYARKRCDASLQGSDFGTARRRVPSAGRRFAHGRNGVERRDAVSAPRLWPHAGPGRRVD